MLLSACRRCARLEAELKDSRADVRRVANTLRVSLGCLLPLMLCVGFQKPAMVLGTDKLCHLRRCNLPRVPAAIIDIVKSAAFGEDLMLHLLETVLHAAGTGCRDCGTQQACQKQACC